MKILGIIPARYGSTRFPGKPLARIRDRSMIEHVYRGSLQSTKLSDLLVATDDARIYDHVLGFGGKAMMTRSDHLSGTHRCAEVSANTPAMDWYINIQGDEPLIHPGILDQLIGLIHQQPSGGIITLVRKLSDPDLIDNPNVVKCVFDRLGKALYFSRKGIPYARGEANPDYYQHLGIYAYSRSVLEAITVLEPTPLETAESLEQLRWMEHGYPVYIGVSEYVSLAVDVPEDIRVIEELMG